MNLDALDHVGLAVADVDRSVEWYQRVLGLERAYQEAWGSYPAVLVTGSSGSGVALFPARGIPIEPSTFDSLPHIGFRVSARAYGEARSELLAAGISFRESDHKVAQSLYLMDPDNHLIEITTYEVAGNRTSDRGLAWKIGMPQHPGQLAWGAQAKASAASTNLCPVPDWKCEDALLVVRLYRLDIRVRCGHAGVEGDRAGGTRVRRAGAAAVRRRSP